MSQSTIDSATNSTKSWTGKTSHSRGFSSAEFTSAALTRWNSYTKAVSWIVWSNGYRSRIWTVVIAVEGSDSLCVMSVTEVTKCIRRKTGLEAVWVVMLMVWLGALHVSSCCRDTPDSLLSFEVSFTAHKQLEKKKKIIYLIWWFNLGFNLIYVIR